MACYNAYIVQVMFVVRQYFSHEVFIMKIFTLFFLALLLTTLSSSLFAGDVDIKWEHPEKYTDIQPSNTSTRKKYQQHIFMELTTYLNKLASTRLPKGYHLKITVTDLDLAGYIEFGPGELQRIVRDIDFPRIKLNYQLIKDKKVLADDKTILKDMNFLHHINTFNNNISFYYEKRLLKEWFKKTIEPLAK